MRFKPFRVAQESGICEVAKSRNHRNRPLRQGHVVRDQHFANSQLREVKGKSHEGSKNLSS
jgi:hypothetical protein